MKFTIKAIIIQIILIITQTNLYSQKIVDPKSLLLNNDIKKSITEIASNVSTIKLESNNVCMIGQVSKVLMYNDFLFVLDTKSNALYKFSKKGVFINKIGELGKGPGEYLSIINFNLFDNQIYIYDAKKFLVFDINGGFKYSIKIDNSNSFVKDFMKVDDQLLLFEDDFELQKSKMSTYLTSIDKLGNEKNKFQLKSNQNLSISFGYNLISKFEDGVFYYNFNSKDTLFFSDFKKITPRLIVANNNIFNTGIISKLKSYILITGYNTKTSDPKISTNILLKDNQDFVNIYYDKLGDEALELFVLNAQKNQLYFYKHGFELEGIIDGVDENSNPVIFVVELKD